MNRDPWFKKLWYRRHYYLRLPYTWPRDRYNDLVAFWQRGRRGWADRDTWNLDLHLAQTLGPMLRHLAETDHGCPPDFLGDTDKMIIQERDGMDYTAWKDYLLDIAAGFDAYVDMQNGAGIYLSKDYETVLSMMRKLFDYYLYLWS